MISNKFLAQKYYQKPSAAPVRETSQQSEKNDFDYSDTNKMACLLCQRQFKTIEVLRKHTTQSDLHKVCDYLSKGVYLQDYRIISRMNQSVS